MTSEAAETCRGCVETALITLLLSPLLHVADSSPQMRGRNVCVCVCVCRAGVLSAPSCPHHVWICPFPPPHAALLSHSPFPALTLPLIHPPPPTPPPPRHKTHNGSLEPVSLIGVMKTGESDCTISPPSPFSLQSSLFYLAHEVKEPLRRYFKEDNAPPFHRFFFFSSSVSLTHCKFWRCLIGTKQEKKSERVSSLASEFLWTPKKKTKKPKKQRCGAKQAFYSGCIFFHSLILFAL